MIYTLLKTDGTREIVQPKDGKKFTLDELQAFVGGYIERVALKSNAMLWVNEEGKLERLPMNYAATQIARETIGFGDYIVGNALLCEPKKRERKET